MSRSHNEFCAGIVYAAGWLIAAHGEDSLAEELLDSADLTTVAKCRAVGAADYDINLARPAIEHLKLRKRRLALQENSNA